MIELIYSVRPAAFSLKALIQMLLTATAVVAGHPECRS